jgi:hypothetical protein
MQHPSIRSTSTTTLEEVQKHFQQWRREKTAHNSHIPDYLWDQVAHIVEYYRQSDILKYLKISRYQLVAAMKSRKKPQDRDSRVALTPQETPDNIPHNPFIKLSMPSVPDLKQNQIPHVSTTPNTQQNTPQIELIHPNGITIRITAMAGHHLSTLLSSFMGMA